MKIVIGCDHAALTLKDAVKAHLLELGHEVKDFGIYQAGEKCDYPEKAAEVARYLRDGNAERGILICGTGVGMSIAANKVKGIRACCCSDTFSARMTRAHNDANILTFDARVIVLFASLFAGLPWLFFVFEIAVLEPLRFYMRHVHESFCRRFAKELEHD